MSDPFSDIVSTEKIFIKSEPVDSARYENEDTVERINDTENG